MRSTEKLVAVLIVALAGWAVLMTVTTGFRGSQSNRILLVQLGTDAASLNRAVEANGSSDREGIAHNVQMVVRNTYMDFCLHPALLVGLCGSGVPCRKARAARSGPLCRCQHQRCCYR